MFCPGSGTEQAQLRIGFTLQAAFVDINIRKSWSVYYWFGQQLLGGGI